MFFEIEMDKVNVKMDDYPCFSPPPKSLFWNFLEKSVKPPMNA
ncbi:hypothetical protein Runsl_5804 (plasmid) [Runella slithyformis DSM 19594]|uniref:Uncharacterized protein n=1 Tax=Runella slithyformis (strain ATCC 29530 / DSM 19594 / LMG 11500 / NCIMB 11436 / LSU 4) TaxID=761193 RepID=A0A7U3ZRV0_RUNSL|nr:hypothetical protein Runsl_5804 [Runella slithyformis DSM 19594]